MIARLGYVIPRGASFITHISTHDCTKGGLNLKLICITYTYVTQILSRTYVHVWRTARDLFYDILLRIRLSSRENILQLLLILNICKVYYFCGIVEWTVLCSHMASQNLNFDHTYGEEQVMNSMLESINKLGQLGWQVKA